MHAIESLKKRALDVYRPLFLLFHPGHIYSTSIVPTQGHSQIHSAQCVDLMSRLTLCQGFMGIEHCALVRAARQPNT